MNDVIIRCGDIYYADLRPVVDSEQGGVRPVLIIQNDVGNKHSPTVICATIISRMNKAKPPTHVELNTRRYAMIKDSVILLGQLRIVDKQRLKEKICHIDEELQHRVDEALMISLKLYTWAGGPRRGWLHSPAPGGAFPKHIRAPLTKYKKNAMMSRVMP